MQSVANTRRPEKTPAEEEAHRQDRRGGRFLARWQLRRFTKFKRFAGCGRWLNGSAAGDVTVKSLDGVAHYSGLQSCGSVWACPVCQAKIRQSRGDELEAAVARWLQAGGGVEFITLTVPHALGDRLGPLFDVVQDGWEHVTSGRPWAGCKEGCTVEHRTGDCLGIKRRYGVVGFARTIEVTYGDNGWHPHVHALLFTDAPLSEQRRQRLGADVFGRWAGRMAKAHGLVCNPEAFAIIGGAIGAGRYIVKVQGDDDVARSLGMEMTRHDLKGARRKGSYTPMALIAPAADGEAWALAAWWEWEEATQGRRCLTWSQGMRDALALEVEKTDEELAAEEVGGEVVLSIDGGSTWPMVVSEQGGEAALLQAVEVGGVEAGVLWLRALRQRHADAKRGPRRGPSPGS